MQMLQKMLCKKENKQMQNSWARARPNQNRKFISAAPHHLWPFANGIDKTNRTGSYDFMSHFGIVNVKTDASASDYRIWPFCLFSLIIQIVHTWFIEAVIGVTTMMKMMETHLAMRCQTCLKWIFYERFMDRGLYLIKIGALVRFQIAFSLRCDKNSCIRFLVLDCKTKSFEWK